MKYIDKFGRKVKLGERLGVIIEQKAGILQTISKPLDEFDIDTIEGANRLVVWIRKQAKDLQHIEAETVS